jgi:hypothetical protein
MGFDLQWVAWPMLEIATISPLGGFLRGLALRSFFVPGGFFGLHHRVMDDFVDVVID